jgi:hypothetical protein
MKYIIQRIEVIYVTKRDESLPDNLATFKQDFVK